MSGQGSKPPFQPEFISVDYAVFTDPDLSHAEKLLFARLKFYAGKNGAAYPKHETLAREMCVSARQVRNLLTKLANLNRICWTRTRSSCVYEIKPTDEWKRLADQDRKNSSSLTGKILPIQIGRRLPTEKKYRTSSSGKKDSENMLAPPARPQVEAQPVNGGPTNISEPPKLDDENRNPRVAPAEGAKVYSSPEAELKDIYLTKTGKRISHDVERRIWEYVELRNATRQDFINALRPHVQNDWHNPAGFLTDFARKIASKMEPEPASKPRPEPPTSGNGRCSLCGGIGKIGDEYCVCSMGLDLKRVERRLAKRETKQQSHGNQERV